MSVARDVCGERERERERVREEQVDCRFWHQSDETNYFSLELVDQGPFSKHLIFFIIN
jgi:hypothetical protein